MDSAGQETPLLNIKKDDIINSTKKEIKKQEKEKNLEKEENSIFEKCLRDKLITETFIQQFIIETSHVLVLVIGAITLNEQKLLERVKKSLSQDKYLYVIHNLQNFQSKKQVDDYIEKTLKQLFGIRIEENNFQGVGANFHQKYYVEKDNIKITHLIFVNDYSQIASYYNEPTIAFLKKKLQVEQNRTEFSAVESVKKYLVKIHSVFYKKKLKKKIFQKKMMTK